jgi:hypothetical protein
MDVAGRLKSRIRVAARLDAGPARPYSPAHEERRDHCHRSPPPPHTSGMGGYLRLRYSLCRRIRSAASSYFCSAI